LFAKNWEVLDVEDRRKFQQELARRFQGKQNQVIKNNKLWKNIPIIIAMPAAVFGLSYFTYIFFILEPDSSSLSSGIEGFE
jgi:hypothetical protein